MTPPNANSYLLGKVLALALAIGAVGFGIGWVLRGRTSETPGNAVNLEQNGTSTAPVSLPTPETLARIQAAAVFLEIEDSQGIITTGSGWFGVEPNWIVTNAHVIRMLNPGSQPPARITAFVYPGITGKQIELPHTKLRILAVDRDMDLALIEVLNPASTLPKPLPLRPSATLSELERLIVLGFPGGRRLAEKNRRLDAPAVSTLTTTVAGLRRDAYDNLFSVQVQGGILHGSSGSALCDLQGNCVGVAVRLDLDHTGRLTGIGYGVPTEYVTGLVAGRAASVSSGQSYVHEDKIGIPLTVHCHDPRKKLQAVGVIAWVGDADAAPRPPGTTRPPAAPADADECEIALKYDAKTESASGELVLPPLTANRAYWVQPWYSNALVPRQYLAAVKLETGGLPVRRQPVELALKSKLNTFRPLHLKRLCTLTDADPTESPAVPLVVRYLTEAQATERILKPAQDDLKSQFQRSLVAKSLSVNREYNEKWEAVTAPQLESIQKGLPGATLRGWQLVSGEMPRTAVESRIADFAPQMVPLLSGWQSAMIPLPNKRIEPLATWNTVREVHWALPSEGFAEGPPVVPTVPDTSIREAITFTYLGLRDRAGRTEAIVAFNGTISPGERGPVGLGGSVWGEVGIDPETGEVLTAKLHRSFDLGFAPGRVKQRWSGTEEITLTRGISEE